MYDVVFESMDGSEPRSCRWSYADAWKIAECLRLNGFYVRIVKRAAP